MMACEYLLLDVPLNDITVLNDYGRDGWRAVAVVSCGVEDFQVLIEKISIDLKPKTDLKSKSKRAA